MFGSCCGTLAAILVSDIFFSLRLSLHNNKQEKEKMVTEWWTADYVCSCEDWRPGHVDIAFNVVDIPSSQCRLYSRRGLCTGWLDDITQPLQHDGKGGGDVEMDLVIQMESGSLEDIEVSVLQVWGMCECVGGWCVCACSCIYIIHICVCVLVCVRDGGGGGERK